MKNHISLIILLLTITLNSYSQGYCTPKYNTDCSGTGDYITNAYTTGALVNFNDQSGNCSSKSYRKDTSKVVMAYPGTNFDLTVETNGWESVRAWIDWNDDGDFADPGEDIGVSPRTNAAKTLPVKVHSSAVYSNNLRMRIRSYAGGTLSSSDYCTTIGNSWSGGESHDYNVVIIGNKCTTPPNAGTLVVSDTLACPSEDIVFTLQGASLGIGNSYLYQYSVDSLTWLNLPISTSPSNVLNITSAAYYRCIMTCSGESDTTNSVFINTKPFTECYCSSKGTNSFSNNAQIKGVKFGSINTLKKKVTTCKKYTNNKNSKTVFRHGQTLPFSVNTAVCSGSWGRTAYGKAYIDYNRNGSFSDAGELVYTFNTFNQVDAQFKGSITCPTSAGIGSTRMRIVFNADWGGFPNVFPCGEYREGETEDYYVKLLPKLANEAAIGDLNTPKNPLCGTTSGDISVCLQNYGIDSLLSAKIFWQVNRPSHAQPFPVDSFVYNGAIAPGDEACNINIGTLQGGFQNGDELKIYSSLPNNKEDSFPDNDTIFETIFSGYLGKSTFTIGKDFTVPIDFTTFEDAMFFLDSIPGICDSLIFNVQDTIYKERVVLPEIPGLSIETPVIFRSISGDPNSVVIRYGATKIDTHQTLYANEVSGYKFNGITFQNNGYTTSGGTKYAQVAKLEFCSEIQFKNCVFRGPIASQIDNDAQLMNLVNCEKVKFLENTFSNGNTGLNSVNSTHIEIHRNRFLNQYYIGSSISTGNNYNFSKNYFKSNSVFSSNTEGAGFYFGGVTPPLKIFNNKVNSSNQFPVHGIQLASCLGQGQNKVEVYNNFVAIGAGYSGNDFSGITVDNSFSCILAHNNVYVAGNSQNNRGVYFLDGGGNELVNNCVYNDGNGYSFYFEGRASVVQSDYNNLYSDGANLARYYVADITDINMWKSAVGYDLNSTSANPYYHGAPSNLHVCNPDLDQMGTEILGNPYAFDYDGDRRDKKNPDIGADEFTPLESYSIGADTGMCVGDSVQLFGGNNFGDNSLWSTGDTGYVFWANNPGKYSIILSNNCGIRLDTIEISQFDAVNLSIESDTNLCSGNSFTLEALGDDLKFNWSTGDTGRSVFINKQAKFLVTALDPYGCESKDSISVTISGLAEIFGTTTYCHGRYVSQNLATEDFQGADYNWSNGDQSAVATITEGGTYWVVLDDKGCVSTDTIEILDDTLAYEDYTVTSKGLTIEITNNSNGLWHLWDFGDGNTSTLKNPTHIYPSQGTYTITYDVWNLCDTVQETTEISVIHSSIEEVNSQSNINIYPNPANQQLSVELVNFTGQNQISVSIISMNGKVLSSEILDLSNYNNLLNFDLNSFNSGIYYIKVQNDYLQHIKKFTIIK